MRCLRAERLADRADLVDLGLGHRAGPHQAAGLLPQRGDPRERRAGLLCADLLASGPVRAARLGPFDSDDLLFAQARLQLRAALSAGAIAVGRADHRAADRHQGEPVPEPGMVQALLFRPGQRAGRLHLRAELRQRWPQVRPVRGPRLHPGQWRVRPEQELVMGLRRAAHLRPAAVRQIQRAERLPAARTVRDRHPAADLGPLCDAAGHQLLPVDQRHRVPGPAPTRLRGDRGQSRLSGRRAADRGPLRRALRHPGWET